MSWILHILICKTDDSNPAGKAPKLGLGQEQVLSKLSY